MGKPSGVYRFAQFTLAVEERQLLREGQPVSLTPKVFDALAYLVENSGRLVKKSELLANVWPDTFVEEATLARTISDLRKALGSSAASRTLIETVPKHGYRFIASKQRPTSVELSRTVGREQDLVRLRTVFMSVSAGQGACLVLSGEAGIGKTTVAEDFLAEIQPPFHTIWIGRGRCSERLAETDAFAPLMESLEELIRSPSGEHAAQLLKAHAPTWSLRLNPASDADQSLATAKAASHERMRREFVAFFAAVSSVAPVVLFFDDLHWADASTCELLAYLVSRAREMRILILGAYRPATVLSGQHPFLRLKLDLERRGWYEELPLSFLRQGDVERYLGLEFPVNQLPEEFGRLVHRRTEGNPLFMRDMLRLLRDRGILEERDGCWHLTQSAGEISQLIPIGVHSMIRLKIQEFGEHDLRILLSAAVQGVEFDSAVLAHALSLDPADVEERLHTLDAVHDVVRLVDELEFPNHTISVRYRFVHIFYQNAIYELLVPSRRTAMSLAVARALVALTGDQSHAYAADLALLFESGRDFANAARYFLGAARDAARVFAYPETEILCHRGLASVAVLPESRERDTQELLFSLTLGMALMSTRGYTAPEVERTLERSRELCLELNATRRLSSVLWGLHTCHTNRGDLTRALEAAREMRQVADAVAEPVAVIESLHALGTTLAFMGRWAEAREALERILELDPVSQHSFRGALYVLDPCVTSLSMLARVLAVEGHLDQAVEKAASSLELAKRLAHPPSLAYATFWMGWVQGARGDWVEGRRDLESSMALSRAHGLQLFIEWGRIVRGSILTQMGSVAEGIAEIRKSIDRLSAMGAMLDRSYCLTVLAEGLGRAGACEEALALCAEALEFARTTKGGWYEPETHRVRGDVLLAMGDDARLLEVETEFAQARELARQAGSRLLELKACISYCRLRRIMGDPDAGFAVLSDVLVGFTEGLHSPVISDARNVANGVARPEVRAPDTV